MIWYESIYKLSKTYSWSLVHGIDCLCSVSSITFWVLRNVDITPPNLVFGDFIINNSLFFWDSTCLFTRWDAKSTGIGDCALIDGVVTSWCSVFRLHGPLVEARDAKDIKNIWRAHLNLTYVGFWMMFGFLIPIFFKWS